MGEVVDERVNRFDLVMEMGRVEGGPSAGPGQLFRTLFGELT
jgi:hypothetical protein